MRSRVGLGSYAKCPTRRLLPPERSQKSLSYKVIDILAAIKDNKALASIRDILRPRQEAVDIMAKRGTQEREPPPFIPFGPPKLGEAPSALSDPAYKRAAKAEGDRRRRSSAKPNFGSRKNRFGPLDPWIQDSSVWPISATSLSGKLWVRGPTLECPELCLPI